MDGKNEQFSQIYDQYIDKIYRFVYLKVSSQETAEDITSKVFLRGWEAFQKQDSDIKNPGAFLYQIARNAVIDHYREKGRTNVISSESLPDLSDTSENIHEKAVLSADVRLVKDAIAEIKKEYQDVIIMHYLEDMSVDEIAKLLGKPSGTIRVMMHRGLKDLRDKVQES